MVNINREVQALAEARDEDVATTRLLFNEAIPGF